MQVIPVIDLKEGAVVRARLGMRATYTPIVTPLARTSVPADVVSGLLRLYPFRTIYVADLDAIEGHGDHDDAIRALSATWPEVDYWVDGGVGTAEAARAFLKRHERAHLVLGSESLRDLASLKELAGDPRVLLSLDFDEEGFRGPDALLETPALWPSRVIVMTLARVGSDAGPDLERVEAVGRLAAGRTVFAAGGLRGPSDLPGSRRAGASGVLVASALHDGRLTAAAIAAAQDDQMVA